MAKNAVFGYFDPFNGFFDQNVSIKVVQNDIYNILKKTFFSYFAQNLTYDVILAKTWHHFEVFRP